MKNVYKSTFRVRLGIDSFAIRSTMNSSNVLVIFSHYTPHSSLELRTGHYVYNKPSEGNLGGYIFIPDASNCITNFKIKEVNPNNILLTCDIFLANKDEVIDLAFCDMDNQKYVSVSPIDKQDRTLSGTDNDYFINFKKMENVLIFTPFEF